MDKDVLPLQRDELDLAYSIRNTYRILDLISEQGSSGLGEYPTRTSALEVPIIGLVSVDRIVISQNSLEAFINSVCPGACVSMTKVNFSALDKYVIKPVGVYGSKEEIVRFLLQLGAIDGTMYVLPPGLIILYKIDPYLTVRRSFLLTLVHMCARDQPSVQVYTSSQHQNELGALIKYLSFIGPSKQLGTTRQHLPFVEIASCL